MAGEENLVITCPSCEESELDVNSLLYNVPYFNELAMFTMKCPSCNFTHNDIFSAEERPPGRWSLRVDNESLLSVRVVRSGSGTIRLPEFGIDVEPGPAAESFISNVEGVLLRIKPVVETAIRFAETETERERGKDVLKMIIKSMNGKNPFTLIIEDPMGVSGILPDDLTLVEHVQLSQEEASLLKGAPVWIDAARQDYTERKG
ncbi:MAG: ZPR1 zinc finger domain-containing protein [Candidatus Thorarchaeota archaeon]|jgi:zinc finger protein